MSPNEQIHIGVLYRSSRKRPYSPISILEVVTHPSHLWQHSDNDHGSILKLLDIEPFPVENRLLTSFTALFNSFTIFWTSRSV